MQNIGGLDVGPYFHLKSYGASPYWSTFRFVSHSYLEVHLFFLIAQEMFSYSSHMSWRMYQTFADAEFAKHANPCWIFCYAVASTIDKFRLERLTFLSTHSESFSHEIQFPWLELPNPLGDSNFWPCRNFKFPSLLNAGSSDFCLLLSCNCNTLRKFINRNPTAMINIISSTYYLRNKLSAVFLRQILKYILLQPSQLKHCRY